jgi:sec-independent protein translocase protein TatA
MISNILLFNFGGSEMILVIVVVLLFFGGKKIPELMRGVGNGIKEFKDASKGEDSRTVDKLDKKD